MVYQYVLMYENSLLSIGKGGTHWKFITTMASSRPQIGTVAVTRLDTRKIDIGRRANKRVSIKD